MCFRWVVSVAVHANLLVNQAERIDQKASVNPLHLDLDHQFTMRRSQSVGGTVNLLIPLAHQCKRRKSTGETDQRVVIHLFHQFVKKSSSKIQKGKRKQNMIVLDLDSKVPFKSFHIHSNQESVHVSSQ